MKTPSQYRAQAREALQNHWGEATIATAIITGIALFCSIPSLKESTNDLMYGIASLYDIPLEDLNTVNKPAVFSWGSYLTTLLAILIIPIEYAFYIALLNLARKNKSNILDNIWNTTTKTYSKMLGTGILYTVIITFVSIFTLGIGGVILSYAYRMVPYLLQDYPELTPREALKISREMMRGNKWRLFVLDLSFIGWILLSIITLCIGMLLVTPYMQTASAFFYEDLKAKTIVEENEEEKEEVEATEVETVE